MSLLNWKQWNLWDFPGLMILDTPKVRDFYTLFAINTNQVYIFKSWRSQYRFNPENTYEMHKLDHHQVGKAVEFTKLLSNSHVSQMPWEWRTSRAKPNNINDSVGVGNTQKPNIYTSFVKEQQQQQQQQQTSFTWFFPTKWSIQNQVPIGTSIEPDLGDLGHSAELPPKGYTHNYRHHL